MRRFLFFLIFYFIASPLVSQDLQSRVKTIQNPKEIDNSWIYDEQDILNNKSEINALLDNLYSQNGTEVAIVILKSIGKESPKEFATALFNEWGIGQKKKNNGVLILHILDQRRIEIEVGYGLEGDLPDAVCKRIIDTYSIGNFKAGNFSLGHLQTVVALKNKILNPNLPFDALVPEEISIEEENRILIERADEKEKEDKKFWGKLYLNFSFTFLALFILLFSFKYTYLYTLKDPVKKYKFVLKYNIYYKTLVVFLPLAAMTAYAHTLISGSFPFTYIPPLILSYLYYTLGLYKKKMEKELKDIRNIPRICKKCKNQMRKLSEEEEDEYLEEGQIAEENAKSKDYDVWVCTCGKIQIDGYNAVFPKMIVKAIIIPKHIKCEKCKFTTLEYISSKTLVKPDYSKAGKIQIIRKCIHCMAKSKIVKSIPKLVRSGSSGSNSSSSSGGGGSFGGGSSGGGGSGGNY